MRSIARPACLLLCLSTILTISQSGSNEEEARSCAIAGYCGATSGGWSEEYAKELDSGVCNIPHVNLVGGPEQLHKSGVLNKPVIFRRRRELQENEVARERCVRDVMLERHGDDVVTLSSANTFSYDKVGACSCTCTLIPFARFQA